VALPRAVLAVRRGSEGVGACPFAHPAARSVARYAWQSVRCVSSTCACRGSSRLCHFTVVAACAACCRMAQRAHDAILNSHPNGGEVR